MSVIFDQGKAPTPNPARIPADATPSFPLPPPRQTRWIARSGFDHWLSRLLSFLYFDVCVLIKRRAQCWRYRGLARHGRYGARAYRPGDERGIIRLFNVVFREGKSLSRWKWEFLQNPCDKVLAAVLENEKAGVVGHYGGLPGRLQYREATMLASQMVDVMIHPAFRSKEPFDRLFRECAAASIENGVRILYGFTSALVARLHRRLIGVVTLPVSQWVCDLRSPQVSQEPAQDDPAVSQVDRFGPDADRLWEEIREFFPCAMIRDSRHLNWRYSPQSDRTYTLWRATDLASGKTVGLAVLAAAGSTGLILELLASPQDQRTMKALLRSAVAHFGRAGQTRALAWFSPLGELHECARAAGFKETVPTVALSFVFLDESLDKAFVRENFYYSLGDYDVY